MAWEWSHTAQAYDNARENLPRLDREDLQIIFAEWRAAQGKGGAIANQGFNTDFNQKKYDRALKYSAGLSHDQLVDFIWDHASDLATCDNGGFNAWVCPFGCHTVSFDPVIDPDKLYWYTSSMYCVEMQLPGQCIIDCSHAGQCAQDVEFWIGKLDLSDLDPEKIRLELSGCGAWDRDELSSDPDNLARFLWSACNDLIEAITQGEYENE